MRLLVPATLAVLALVAAGCTSKVGVAATYNGHTITDSQVASYLTTAAQPVQSQGNGGATVEEPARTFVLTVMLQDRLFDKILNRLPGGRPSEATIQEQITTQLAGKTPDQIAQMYHITGYTEAFVNLFVRVVVLNQTISGLVQQGTVDPTSLLKNLDFHVTVSPRYGTWDPKAYGLDGSGGAGAPAFVTLRFPDAQPAR